MLVYGAHLGTDAFAMNLTTTVDAKVAEINLRGPQDESKQIFFFYLRRWHQTSSKTCFVFLLERKPNVKTVADEVSVNKLLLIKLLWINSQRCWE